MNIRAATPNDLADIERVLEDTDLFPPDMLEEMIELFFSGSPDERWLVCELEDAGVMGFSYARTEMLTEGTWNLLAIGFRVAHQGQGYGTAMIEAVEHALDTARVLIVETSGLDDFAATRHFYETHGYTKEAVIRDYWADGDDKVIYWKALAAQRSTR